MESLIKCAGPLLISVVLAAFLVGMCADSVWALDADPAKLPRQRANAIGYPSRDPNLDVLPGFVEPPPGYGEVPFYWWLGDPLTKERLARQLEQFKGMGISGLQINYAHSDKGGNMWGLTYPSDPSLFSDEWWKLVQWWSGECQKQGIAVSLSDYTLGIVGQGYWMDEILAEDPDMRGRVLEQVSWQTYGGKTFSADLPENTISVVAYPRVDGKRYGKPAINLTSKATGRALKWTVEPGAWDIVAVYPRLVKNSVDPINSKTGAKIIEKFFARFENHLPGQAGKGLNFFFSDELNFGIAGNLWNDRFAAEFAKRKGYDIKPKLAAIFTDIGPETPKIRLDYHDVLVSLSEESYFEPVFRWHYDRGMIYGCDHGGRGTDVTEFGDYFRTQRWMTGPGCDQPQCRADLIKNKVASSIAHLYERPRVWLEGYHSSGWGTNTAQLTSATFANFAMGQNLLSLHGLYYSTHGGFWEWAPPCNHFRMPYWAHMDVWMKCIRRLSYLMSQGVHKCDVAIIYPVAAVEAAMGDSDAVGIAFDAGRRLGLAIDFDYMDFQSLERAQVKNRELCVSGEAYKVLVIPAMKTVRFSTIKKALEFKRSGGTVIAIGALPEASDRMGRDDAQLNSMVEELFGRTPSTLDDLLKTITESIDRDFISPNGCIVNHRKIGKRDVYMVVGARKDSQCFFRATGKVELWDPWTGKTTSLAPLSTSKDGTTLRMPLEDSEAQLIVFSPGSPEPAQTSVELTDTEFIPLDGLWDFELVPTMDNTFGDFRLPVTSKMIGAEARLFSYAQTTSASLTAANPPADELKAISYEFGQRFWKLGPIDKDTDTTALEAQLAKLDKVDPSKPVVVNDKCYSWEPYEYGLRQGIQGDPGHQGYHGLKANINDDFIALGKRHVAMTDSTYSSESETAGNYYLWTAVRSDNKTQARIIAGGMVPSGVWLAGNQIKDMSALVSVTKGATPLLLRYDGAGRGHFIMQTGDAVNGPDYPLAMSWYTKPDVLLFDPRPELDRPVGWYQFTAPPGLRSMTVFAHGDLQVLANGKSMSVESKGRRADGARKYVVSANADYPETATVCLIIAQDKGYYGGAAIPEPISLDCAGGKIPLGNWYDYGLECYSGGAWYRKTIALNADQAKGRVTLKLRDLVSSAEVHVNGKLAAIKLAPPWDIDISALTEPGQNTIEVLVYNTLANHYITIPTHYRGNATSGLIGPVRLQITRPAVPNAQPNNP